MLRAVSIDGLNAEDPGLALVGGALTDADPAGILLVFCGEPPGVGAGATRLVLDVRERATAEATCVDAGLDPPDLSGFAQAAVWPRPHLGKDFSEYSLAVAARALAPEGVLWMAARKNKGVGGLMECARTLLGQAHVVKRDKGCHLVRAIKTDRYDEALVSELLSRRYTYGDPVLGDLELGSAPGVFSRRGLDAGTRALLEHVQALQLAPSLVLDLGAGIGPLGLWAARRWSDAKVLAVDTNLLAVELLRNNAMSAGVADRVTVWAGDGLQAGPPSARGKIDLALVNPPTHAPPEALRALLGDLATWLARPARAFVVVNRPGRATEALTAAGARVQVHDKPGYVVLEATWGEDSARDSGGTDAED
jgi:16S rRNA G1207 methylase RsmC